MPSSNPTSSSLSAPEDGSVAVPREDPVPRKKDTDTHRFMTPSGVQISLKRRGARGWFLDHKPPWSNERIRTLVTKGTRDEAVRMATAQVEELYRANATPNTPSLINVAAQMLVHKRKEGRAEGYRRKLEEHLRGYIAPALGADTQIGSITAKELLAFKHHLASGDLDGESVNRILTTLRQIFKFAEDPAGIITAPALPRNVRTAAWQKRERWQILAPVEIEALLLLAPDEVRPLIGYLVNTGLRVGSALLTQTSWIDFENRRVRYPASAMKGRHAHTVDLNTAAEMFLRQAVAMSPSKPFDYSYWFVLDRWFVIRKALGKPTLRIHDLRHSFVSNQLAAGTPVHVVKDMAAHRSLAVTSLYSHSSDEARRAAADRVQIGVPPPSPDVPRPVEQPAATTAQSRIGKGPGRLRIVK